MRPKRWRPVERVWDEALDLSREGREAFVYEVCAGDNALRGEVASLLAAHDQSAGFVEEPALWHSAALLALARRRPS